MSFIKPAMLLTGVLTASAAWSAPFSLSSPDLDPHKPLPEAQVANSYGCTGKNLSPALAWKNAPKAVKSYALTVYDPDAPTGSGWWHWVVYNIPTQTTALAAGAGIENSSTLPPGAVQGRTDGGNHSFGGACPPAGDKPHRYIFTIHALSTEKIELPADASAALVGFMIHNSEIGKASFTVKYGR